VSVKVMAAVWELDLPLRDKFVLLGFADHANDEGDCFPSMARIAWKCGLSKATVKRSVQLLMRQGLLSRSGIAVGRYGTTRYVVQPVNGVKLHPFRKSVAIRGTATGSAAQSNGVTAMAPESSFKSSVNHQRQEDYYSHPKYGEQRRARRDAEQRDVLKRLAGVR
jgi:hypothetical protein